MRPRAEEFLGGIDILVNQVESLVWKLLPLAQYDEGVPRPWYKSLLLWFGVYAVILTYLHWRFW